MKIKEKKKYLEIYLKYKKDVIKVKTENNQVIYIEFKNGDLIVTKIFK